MPQVETYTEAEFKRSMAGYKTILERSMHELWRHVEHVATKAHHDIISCGGTKAEANEAYNKIISWVQTDL